MANDELRVPIALPVETNASQAADSVEALRDSIASSKDAIKATAAALRDLKGNSDEVKRAKDQLKLTLRAEEAAVAASTVKLIKHGESFDKLAVKAKAAKLAEEAAKVKTDAMGRAVATAGGPIASLKAKLQSMNEVLGGSAGGMAALVGVTALAAAGIVAVGAAAAGALTRVGKFIIATADAARMMQLTRKANLAGRDDWAKNFGDQVDRLARTIPVTKEQLNELGISLAKSRIGGQTMVDTLEAVSGAAAAAGDDLGNKLKGLVDRGALTRRFQVSPQELMGMDLDFSDVAKAYAEGMHVSVAKARTALLEGRVKLADGAAALKKAVNAKFGAINAEKMLGLDNQLVKLKADLASLVKDVNIKPILEGIKKLADNFDQTSVNGKALRNIVTTIGKAIGATFEEGVPIVQEFIDQAVLGALKIENYWLRAKIAFRETFGNKTTLEFTTFKAALGAVAGVAKGVVPMFSLVSDGAKLLAASWNAVGDNFKKTSDLIVGLKDSILGIDWPATGTAVVDGIVSGLEDGGRRLVDKVKGLAGDIKQTFKDTLKISSPSKVFEEYGKSTTEGYAKGVEGGAGRAEESARAMAPIPGGSGGAGRGGAVTITFSPTIVVQGGGGGGDVKAQLQDPSLLQALYQQFAAQMRAAGFEVAA